MAAANAAAGGDFGKNMEALVSEQGVRSLLESMVLAGNMNLMGTYLKDPNEFNNTERFLTISLVKTLTSNIVGGEDLQKSLLTALGSSLDNYILGHVKADTVLEKAEKLALAGALGAYGAKLTGGDSYQAAFSSMVTEMADWATAKPMTAEEKKNGALDAELSQCSYSDEPCNKPDDVKKFDDKSLREDVKIDPKALADTGSGMHAELYQSDKAKQIVMSIRGTTLSVHDWVTNFVQAIFGGTQQYTKLALDTKTLRKIKDYAKAKCFELVVTGHSMGGGIATLLASTGYFDKAIVFNASGVNDATFAAVKGDKALAAAKTTDYYSRADVLTNIQDMLSFVIPAAIGKRVLMDGAGLHTIKPIVKAFDEKDQCGGK